MRGKRVKALRLEAQSLGVTLSKRGWRRLKKAYNGDRKMDVREYVRKLVRDDIRKAGPLSKMPK